MSWMFVPYRLFRQLCRARRNVEVSAAGQRMSILTTQTQRQSTALPRTRGRSFLQTTQSSGGQSGSVVENLSHHSYKSRCTSLLILNVAEVQCQHALPGRKLLFTKFGGASSKRRRGGRGDWLAVACAWAAPAILLFTVKHAQGNQPLLAFRRVPLLLSSAGPIEIAVRC